MYLGINTIEIDPIEEIKKSFSQNGIALPDSYVFDGEIHRFRADYSKPENNENGWYVFFSGSDVVNGVFGDWASDVRVTFHSSNFDTLSEAEKRERNQKSFEAMKKAEADRIEKQETVSESCEKAWFMLSEADTTNPYIARKGLKNAYGTRVDKDRLVVPLQDENGKIWSLQYISPDGTKNYRKGGRVKGCFWIIGTGKVEYLCEGFATAASVYEATGKTTAIAFSANNLVDVSKVFPTACIVADNDESKTGENKAKESGNQFILIPEVGMDANDYAVKYGSKKLAELLGKKKNKYKLIDGSDWLVQTAPKEWLIKGYILKGKSLSMIFGKSGNGKTFVVVEMMMALATGNAEALPVTKKAKVLYLCGEGDESVKERMAVWYQQHNVELKDIKDNLKIEPVALKMDNPKSAALLVEEINSCQFVPDVIFIDTLARYMGGDENDTKNANDFVAACDYLENEYNCGVVLVHHTGQAEETQKRERGSSVFRGALDMQLRVDKTNEVITLINTKNKGGKELEGLRFELKDHVIDGFVEEDGSAVTCAVLVRTNEPVKPEKRVTQRQLDDEDLVIHAFMERGKLIVDKAYISSDDLIDWLVLQTGKTKDAERKQVAIRPTDYKDKPRLMERMQMYGDIEVDWGHSTTQIPRGFWCNYIERDGVQQPHFYMSLDTGHQRTPTDTA